MDWAGESEFDSLTGDLALSPECGSWKAGTYAHPRKGSHHVHALPGALQRPDAPPPPLPGLRLREYTITLAPICQPGPCPPCLLQLVQKCWALTRPDVCVTSFGPHGVHV